MELPRWLALAGPGEAEDWRPNLTAFRRLVLVHVAVRSFLLLPDPAGPAGIATLGPAETPLRLLAIALALLGLVPGCGVWAARLLCLVIGTEIGLTLPEGTNHVAVELALLVFLALLDERDEDEGRLLLCAVRWYVAVFFAYTGVQKLLYGYYFQGQFLAFAAATEERFRALFHWFIPGDELQRLLSYNEREIRPGVMQPRVGAGPYLVDSTLFVLLSNAVYVFEIVAGSALLVPRLRQAAAVAVMVFVVLIEAGARELTFGLLMINLMLLFLDGAWNRRLFWVLVAGYGYLVLHELAGWDDVFTYSPA